MQVVTYGWIDIQAITQKVTAAVNELSILECFAQVCGLGSHARPLTALTDVISMHSTGLTIRCHLYCCIRCLSIKTLCVPKVQLQCTLPQHD